MPPGKLPWKISPVLDMTARSGEILLKMNDLLKKRLRPSPAPALGHEGNGRIHRLHGEQSGHWLSSVLLTMALIQNSSGRSALTSGV